MHPPTDHRSSASEVPPSERQPGPPREPRQRWQLVFRRGPVAADLVGRAAIDAWQSALTGSGLALAQLDATQRPRVAFGAPLPAVAEGEAELAEIVLAERVPAWRVREALAERMPPGHTLVSAEDVWLGAPALPGRVTAADWRVELEAAGIDRVALGSAADRLLAATSLPRRRQRAGADKAYDLRPLLDDVRLDPPVADGELLIVRIRTRFRPDLGSGRPDEVVAALAEACGAELAIRRTVREQLLLGEDASARKPG